MRFFLFIVPFRSGGDAGPPKKKKNNRGKQKNTQGKHVNMNKTQHQKPPPIPFQKGKTSAVKKGFGTKEQNIPEPKVHNGMKRTQNKPKGKVLVFDSFPFILLTS